MNRSREAIANASRIVVKIGSSSLATLSDGLDDTKIGALVEHLARAKSSGREVVLVSSGAIAAGLAPLGITHRPRDLARQQAAASVGQSMLMAHYTTAFAAHGLHVGQVLLTLDDVTRRSHYRNAYRTVHKLLAMGVVPIVNENDTVATDEIRFGDNDRLAALVAQLIHADTLILLSDVDGLYDGDPRGSGSTRLEQIHDVTDLEQLSFDSPGVSGLGSGGMRAKVDAVKIATGSGIDVVLAAAGDVGPALSGEEVGTWFHRQAKRRSTRLLWLQHASIGQGSITLDAGAVRAITERGASLLPAGIVEVTGTFAAGDPVDLVDESGHLVARGFVNFDADELPELVGRSTRELAAELGPTYEREVVHRNDLALL